ncbi:SHOCT domain-containing protein [Kribbella sp. NPDC050470]|uniref:SHOCT domain-containing protein n=1 Tax=unclassified Kribbella TaxID=2644121 RepID=UPI0037B83CC3
MARTAVIAGTATAVSGGVQRRAADKAAAQQQAADQAAAQQQAAAQAAAQQQAQPAAAPAGAGGVDDRIAKIRELGELKAQGLLTEAEFAAEKARVLSM